MAKKRMFNIDIVENDVFLDMPLTSQSLYFHLGMNADDDGFVSPKRIMRMIGANDDDLKILIAKRYVLTFPSGVVVIKHWHKNNTLKNDRIAETTYKKEKASLTKNEWGQYTELSRITTNVLKLQGSETEVVQDGSIMEPQYSIDKVSIVEGSIDIYKPNINNNPIVVADSATGIDKKEKTKSIDGMFEYWKDQVGYDVSSKVKQNRDYCSKLLKEYSKKEIAFMIRAAALASEDQYSPGVSNFIDLYRKWDQLQLWGKKKGTKIKSRVGVIS